MIYRSEYHSFCNPPRSRAPATKCTPMQFRNFCMAAGHRSTSKQWTFFIKFLLFFLNIFVNFCFTSEQEIVPEKCWSTDMQHRLVASAPHKSTPEPGACGTFCNYVGVRVSLNFRLIFFSSFWGAPPKFGGAWSEHRYYPASNSTMINGRNKQSYRQNVHVQYLSVSVWRGGMGRRNMIYVIWLITTQRYIKWLLATFKLECGGGDKQCVLPCIVCGPIL